jgi:hypothetical protein
MEDRKLSQAKREAKNMNIKNWKTLEISTRKNKRFSIESPSGRTVHFGLWPFKGHGTFLDHKDVNIRDAWRARHSKIMIDNMPAYKNPESPEFYSWYVLW